MTDLRSIQLIVTTGCNFKCDYCYQDKISRKDMPLVTALQALEYCSSSLRGKFHVSMFGGEPLLVFDMLRDFTKTVGQSSPHNNITYSITTNGSILNSEIADWIFENRIKVHLSIDGIGEAQNCGRKTVGGHDTFHLIDLDLWQKINQQQRVRLCLVITPDNIRYLYESIKHMHCRGFRSFTLERATNMEWPDEAIEEFISQYKLVTEYFLKFLNTPARFIIPELDFVLAPYIARPSAKKPPENSHIKQIGCSALGDKLVVSPEGDLYPCDKFLFCSDHQKYKLGSLDDHQLLGRPALLGPYLSKLGPFGLPTCSSCQGKCLQNCIAEVAASKENHLQKCRLIKGFIRMMDEFRLEHQDEIELEAMKFIS